MTEAQDVAQRLDQLLEAVTDLRAAVEQQSRGLDSLMATLSGLQDHLVLLTVRVGENERLARVAVERTHKPIQQRPRRQP